MGRLWYCCVGFGPLWTFVGVAFFPFLFQSISYRWNIDDFVLFCQVRCLVHLRFYAWFWVMFRVLCVQALVVQVCGTYRGFVFLFLGPCCAFRDHVSSHRGDWWWFAVWRFYSVPYWCISCTCLPCFCHSVCHSCIVLVAYGWFLQSMSHLCLVWLRCGWFVSCRSMICWLVSGRNAWVSSLRFMCFSAPVPIRYLSHAFKGDAVEKLLATYWYFTSL